MCQIKNGLLTLQSLNMISVKVSYVISDSNNNDLVFDTFDKAIARNPDAHPLCYSDRGYQILVA